MNLNFYRAVLAGVLLLFISRVGSAAMPESIPAPAAAGSAFGVGAGQFEFVHAGKKIRVLTWKPASYQGAKDAPVLVLLHGASRNAEDYLKSGKILAEKLHGLLVVPEFDRARFDPGAYQEGGVFRGKKLVAKEEWTFQAIVPLIEAVRTRENRGKMPCYLIGHSAGAQFLSRMAGLLPENPVQAKRIVLVNPGSLLFPTRSLPYPYGYGGLPEEISSDEKLKSYLAAPLTFFIGTADTGTKRLPTDKNAMAQGATRIERARHCYEVGQKLARENGWPFGWNLIEAEGLDHRSTPMWEHKEAVRAIVGE